MEEATSVTTHLLLSDHGGLRRRSIGSFRSAWNVPKGFYRQQGWMAS
jgi:hypothetical protein